MNWPEAPVLASPRTEDLLPLGLLADDLRRGLGLRPRIERNAFGPADVRIRRALFPPKEGFRLSVRDRDITVEASTSAGAYYGIQTLRDLGRVEGRRLTARTLDEAPAFKRRGVYLDCSRGKVPTVEALVALVERLGSWKINELQLYMENVFTWTRHPAIGRGYSPFRPGDLLEVQDACREHHIRLVPSLASFGHLERILGLPDYRHLAELPGHLDLPGGTTLCPGDARSIKLVQELWEELVPLFTAGEVNACGDETWELGRGRSRKRAARIGVGEVYLDFVLKLHRLAARHHRRLAIWSDIVLNHPGTLSHLPDDVTLLNWEYAPGGERVARTAELTAAGFEVLVCPGTHGWQSHGTRLAESMANVIEFVAEGRRRGAAGVLMTDWGDYGHRNPLGVSLHGFAHAAAHAWRPGGDDSRFTETFCRRALGQADDRLAGHLRTIGAADATAGTQLYHALTDPFDAGRDPFEGIPRISPIRVPPGYRRQPIEQGDPDGCRRVVEESDAAAEEIQGLAHGLESFVRLAVEEIALAALMNGLAARRILIGKAHREDRAVPSRDREALADATRRGAREFERLWRARNRPSRLRDNLRLFASTSA